MRDSAAQKHVTTITATWYTNDHRTEGLEREKMNAALEAIKPIFTDATAETTTIIGRVDSQHYWVGDLLPAAANGCNCAICTKAIA